VVLVCDHCSVWLYESGGVSAANLLVIAQKHLREAHSSIV
jgi:hypothetical protein